MAVPKRKVSPSRRGKRRLGHKTKAPTFVENKDSGELHRPHHIDLKTGMYNGKQILAQASSLDKELKATNGGNVEAAEKVGELVAKRAIEQGIKKVTFDRSGYKYHGRVKSLADGARSQGLEF